MINSVSFVTEFVVVFATAMALASNRAYR